MAPFTPTPQVRAASVNEALRRVAAMGQSPEEACRRASITADDLEHDDRMVSLAQAVALFEECAQLTGDAHFGLHLGATTDHGMLGDLSYVARHSPTVGKALHKHRPLCRDPDPRRADRRRAPARCRLLVV